MRPYRFSVRAWGFTTRGLLLILLVAVGLALGGCMSDGDSSSSRGNASNDGGSSHNDGGSGGGSDDDDDNGSGGSGGDLSVTLSWVPPASRQDGSPISLSEISNYEIVYGTESGEYSESVSVEPNGCDCHELSQLSSGQTYYLAMKVQDIYGATSGFSEEVSFSLD